VRRLDDLVAELPIAQHPRHGAYRVVPPPVRFGVTPASVRLPAPMLGEHGRSVLREIGMSTEEIEELVANDVLRHVGAET
jgi:formyl-CoA transferase